MAQSIIDFICGLLVILAAGAFAPFVVFKLREIKDKTDNILISRHPWGMGVYMDEIPQNAAGLVRVPVKIYDKSEYSDIIVPRKGEEISGVYHIGENEFEMTGIVKSVFYNTDLDWITVECKCTEIHKIY